MRFVTYDEDGDRRCGVLAGDTVHPLPVGVSLLGLLRDSAGDALATASAEALADDSAVRPVTGLRLVAPIPDPPTVRDFMTFESHVEGVGMLADPGTAIMPAWYDAPAFYFTNPYAIIGPYDDVPVPPGCSVFDLELEIAAVVGRAGRDLTPEEAENHIAGFTILVDWSARDIQFAEMAVRLGPAKGKDTSTTLGPFLVTPDELEPWRSGTAYDLGMSAHINGEPLGGDRWDSMSFSFGEMLAYASRGTEIRPGDVLGSGTCGGGCLAELWGRQGRAAHRPLAPGDIVEVEVERLGRLRSQIVAGVAPVPLTRKQSRLGVTS